MTVFGFRLFTVSIHQGRKQTAVAWKKAESGPSAAQSTVFAALTAAKGQLRVGGLKYRTVLDEDSDVGSSHDGPVVKAEKNPIHIRIEDVAQAGTTINVDVRYGREGDFDKATGAGRADVLLAGLASTRALRVSFLFPDQGSRFIVVSETRGRTHVAEVLLKLLSVLSNEGCANPAMNEWNRWSAQAITDPARVQEVIKDGQDVAITLRRQGPKASGGETAGEVTLRQNGIASGQSDVLTKVLLGWAKKRVEKKDVAKQLEVLIDSNVGDVEFNDGEVSFDEKGKRQTITPATIERIFVYPTGNQPLSHEALLRAGAARLVKLLPGLGVELDLAAYL